jgi:hypothetical protein
MRRQDKTSDHCDAAVVEQRFAAFGHFAHGVMVEVGERYADFRGIMIRGHCEVIEDSQVVKGNDASGR